MMKKIALLIFSVSLVGCSFDMKGHDEVETIDKIEIKEEPKQENLQESNEDAPKIEDVINDEPIDSRIYSYSDYDRTDYETIPYLSLGDSVSITKENNEIGTVTLDSVEVIYNAKGYDEKSIVLHFTETNTGGELLELGIQGPTLAYSHLFYNDIYLDQFGIIDREFYDKIPDYPDSTLCDVPASLEPNENRKCFQVHSYSGAGDYLVSQGTEATPGAPSSTFKSYLIKIQ